MTGDQEQQRRTHLNDSRVGESEKQMVVGDRQKQE
jgi:hypothetical protein